MHTNKSPPKTQTNNFFKKAKAKVNKKHIYKENNATTEKKTFCFPTPFTYYFIACQSDRPKQTPTYKNASKAAKLLAFDAKPLHYIIAIPSSFKTVKSLLVKISHDISVLYIYIYI